MAKITLVVFILWCVPVVVVAACSQPDSDAYQTETLFFATTGNPWARKQAMETSARVVEHSDITKNKNEFINAIVQAQLVAERARLQYDLSDLYMFAKSLPEGFRASRDLDYACIYGTSDCGELSRESEDLHYALWMFRQSLPQVQGRLPKKNAFLYKSSESILSFNTDSQYAQSVPGRDTWIKLRTDCKIATHLNIQHVKLVDTLEHYIDESTQHSRNLQYVVDGYTSDLGSVPDNIDERFVGIVISEEESEIYIHENSFTEGNVLEILYGCDS